VQISLAGHAIFRTVPVENVGDRLQVTWLHKKTASSYGGVSTH